MDTTFVETNCKFSHEGIEFESGGSYIGKCSDGLYRGIVYVDFTRKVVTTWHGEVIAPLDRWTLYRGNFTRYMARISFTYNGIKFIGDYCTQWADACKVRSTKKYQ